MPKTIKSNKRSLPVKATWDGQIKVGEVAFQCDEDFIEELEKAINCSCKQKHWYIDVDGKLHEPHNNAEYVSAEELLKIVKTARKKRDKTGEIIELFWPHGSQELYVHGHMTPQEAREILEDFYSSENCYEEGDYTFEDPKLAYGRWSMEYKWADSESGLVLRVYNSPGCGRFPIMVAKVVEN
jgi:hypothetical protein